MTEINETLRVVDAAIVCRCGHNFGPATENYKLHALVREGPVQNAGPWVDPQGIGDDRFVCREFFCPGWAISTSSSVASRSSGTCGSQSKTRRAGAIFPRSRRGPLLGLAPPAGRGRT